jgi:hypothetical protein
MIKVGILGIQIIGTVKLGQNSGTDFMARFIEILYIGLNIFIPKSICNAHTNNKQNIFI